MKTQGCLLYPRTKYVKTEEIAERKGVIFPRVCVCTKTVSGGGKATVPCMREKHMYKSESVKGEKEPGLQFADLS